MISKDRMHGMNIILFCEEYVGCRFSGKYERNFSRYEMAEIFIKFYDVVLKMGIKINKCGCLK